MEEERERVKLEMITTLIRLEAQVFQRSRHSLVGLCSGRDGAWGETGKQGGKRRSDGTTQVIRPFVASGGQRQAYGNQWTGSLDPLEESIIPDFAEFVESRVVADGCQGLMACTCIVWLALFGKLHPICRKRRFFLVGQNDPWKGDPQARRET